MGCVVWVNELQSLFDWFDFTDETKWFFDMRVSLKRNQVRSVCWTYLASINILDYFRTGILMKVKFDDIFVLITVP